MHHPHVESPDIARQVDRLLAERGDGLLSIKQAVALLRERTGTDRSDADLAGLIVKKAAYLGIAVLSDEK
ncbi:hypothetical protein FJW07_05655 [Mesorhizobium sp. B3-1-9]|uniref:hypothetical protein n=1 Tax=unclassified Mesorhizobium TaxID=325217 RepID=UPI00112C9742|nr:MULTISPECIES: hypothetical protein [unclassified Mesorhizobium]TPI36041.1 hypothetical protein FJ414_16350 [Mesorhizobium sp. B3-1-6]TPI41986.1 hypothetical protein FJW07_05655 [Mesorhizobium sp. B3-1-9]TPI55874.1 hypothetical protein FJ417_23615 [Mesorhizobium sp. B3-1-7]TPI70751.1 hypothetical protein FJ424_02610 [Mesorhizobium sp. B3-1-8]TPI74492.1 hypothetical protein FJ420_06100 [Mesorhizobium sp. B3-1-3]